MNVIVYFFRDFLDGGLYILWVIICLILIMLSFFHIRKKRKVSKKVEVPVVTYPEAVHSTSTASVKEEIKSPYSGDRL